MGEGSIENFAFIQLLPNYLFEDGVVHGVVGESGNIVRARVSLLIHQSMSIDEVGMGQAGMFCKPIHVMHE
jgi:hypothetical protein